MKTRLILLMVAGILSALYLGIVLLLQIPRNNYGSIIDLITSATPTEIGDLFAWFLSILAFLWLVGAYLFQSRELNARTNALQADRRELERMRDALDAQVSMVRLIERQTEIEDARVRPYFIIKSIGGTLRTKAASIENTGAAAYEVMVRSDGDPAHTEAHVATGQRFSVSAKAHAERGLTLEICFKDAGDRFWSQIVKWDAGRATSSLPKKQIIIEESLAPSLLDESG